MSILYVGIGSSGLNALEEAQQFNYELNRKNVPQDVHYLYLDTDLSKKPRKTPLGSNDITGISLSLEQMAFPISQFIDDPNIDSSWIPPVNTALGASGAGGMSSYGRLAFWIHFTAIKGKLLELNKSYKGFDSVFVVGSLTGGTGSGTIIDLAYLIRSTISPSNLISLLMIPKESDLETGTSNYFLNSFFTLKSIEYYSDERAQNEYKITWPDGNPLPSTIGNQPPFDLNILISPDYFHQSNIDSTFICDYNNLSPLFKTVGLLISLLGGNQDRGLRQVLESRIVDGATGAGHITRFISIGLAFIQYPKALLEEFIALGYATSIVEDWNSLEKYKGKEVFTKVKASKDAEDSLDHAINTILNDVQHNECNSLDQYIKQISVSLSAKDIEPFQTNADFIFDVFKSNSESNLYRQVKNKLFVARDSIIKDLHNGLEQTLSNIPNLQIAKYYLEGLEQQLTDIVSFWNLRYNIDENPASWNTIISRKTAVLEKELGGFSIYNLKQAFLEEQLNDMLYLMKMHLMIVEVDRLKKGLGSPETSLITTDNAIKLPSRKRLDEIMVTLQNITYLPTSKEVGQDPKNEKVLSFRARSSQIQSMSVSYGMVSNLYPKGDFNGEINTLKAEVDLQKVITPKLILGNENLHKFLNERSNFYFDILSPIVKAVNSMPSQNRMNFASLISQSSTEEHKKMIIANQSDLNDAPPALVKLDRNIGSKSKFQDSPNLKTIYLYRNQSEFINFRNSIRQERNEPTDSIDEQAFVESKWDNALAIFKSYGYYGGNVSQDQEEKSLIPTRDLASMKNTQEKHLRNQMLTDEYVLNRIPYLSKGIASKILID
jgi:hypothetical protein